MENPSKDKLISFLQNLIITVEQDKLSNKQYQTIFEFYTCYKFKERKNDLIFSSEDYLKFLTLGWYIYSQMESTSL
jgi:hypothetical protein